MGLIFTLGLTLHRSL